MATSLKLPYGLRGEQLLHISQVETGLACGCTCPGCGATLVARNAARNVKAAHFAHHKAAECSTGLQTAIHLAANEIIARHKQLCLPGVAGNIALTPAFWDSFSFDARPYSNDLFNSRGFTGTDAPDAVVGFVGFGAAAGVAVDAGAAAGVVGLGEGAAGLGIGEGAAGLGLGEGAGPACTGLGGNPTWLGSIPACCRLAELNCLLRRFTSASKSLFCTSFSRTTRLTCSLRTFSRRAASSSSSAILSRSFLCVLSTIRSTLTFSFRPLR